MSKVIQDTGHFLDPRPETFSLIATDVVIRVIIDPRTPTNLVGRLDSSLFLIG